ncbi:hypothetical protein [Phenylobacterium sp.]|uniref:hypothetical protein n=1 Tax=Phenylobacterium sp. TaxID=1871053 RepID=UPI0025D4ECD4|nr:hypothetical protein [Phenylobacterium sp.]MBX3482501.1 hypothetical protein [Phenylobacterium sp.]
MSARRREIDLTDHGPLKRADGAPAYNGYFWSCGENNHYQLRRYADRDWMLWVVPLNDGRWLANPPGSYLRGPFFPSREVALRTAVARVLWTLRQRRRPHTQSGHHILFYHVSPAAAGHVQAWLFDILIRNFGRRRRWRRRRAIGRAQEQVALAETRYDWIQRDIQFAADRRAGEYPRRGKRAQDAWGACYDAAVEIEAERRAAKTAAALMRLSAAELRLQRVAAARPA